MRVRQRISTFTLRYPLVGPVIWILCIQYFLIQITVAGAWSFPYSWLHNAISDLGAVTCGTFSGRPVCSPWHDLMNSSFVMLGITMFLGAGLIYDEFRHSRASAIGFTGMAIGGFGTILVGLFPEDVNSTVHSLGAALPFFVGNIGMVILSRALQLPVWLRVYTLLSGVVSLIALALFGMHQYIGLGLGGIERIVSYPQTAWLIVFGVYISKNRIQERRAARRAKLQRPPSR